MRLTLRQRALKTATWEDNVGLIPIHYFVTTTISLGALNCFSVAV